jgi:putative FmdB family regulatory protein
MPTYEYECTKCGHTFEAFQSIKDEPLSRCPECKGAVRRVINGGMGVIFKGSGFYTTDYKKSSALTGGNGHAKDKEKSSSESSGPKESSSSSSSTEKKPSSS